MKRCSDPSTHCAEAFWEKGEQERTPEMTFVLNKSICNQRCPINPFKYGSNAPKSTVTAPQAAHPGAVDYPHQTKNSSSTELLQKAASRGCSTLASRANSSLGTAGAAFVKLWAQIHSPCQTLLGSTIIHLWSLNNVFAQVPGDRGPMLPVCAHRLSSGIWASHGSPLAVLDQADPTQAPCGIPRGMGKLVTQSQRCKNAWSHTQRCSGRAMQRQSPAAPQREQA